MNYLIYLFGIACILGIFVSGYHLVIYVSDLISMLMPDFDDEDF